MGVNLEWTCTDISLEWKSIWLRAKLEKFNQIRIRLELN